MTAGIKRIGINSGTEYHSFHAIDGRHTVQPAIATVNVANVASLVNQLRQTAGIPTHVGDIVGHHRCHQYPAEVVRTDVGGRQREAAAHRRCIVRNCDTERL